MEQVTRTDIQNADHVATLVREFYTRVYADEVLRPVFADVAKVDLEEHLPKMNRFWGTILLGEQSYRGNPLKVHHALNSLKPFNECHFIRWLSLFCMTVDKLFSGPRAEYAKESARRINKSIEWSLDRARCQASLSAPDIVF